MKLSQTLRTTALASVIALVGVLPSQAATEFLQVVNVSSNDALNMRAGPTTNSNVIGSIPYNGQTVVSTGNRQGSWVEVNWAGQTGWVNERFVQGVQTTNNRATQQTRQQRPTRPARPRSEAVSPAAVAHTHPANECTNSVTHSHPNGGSAHTHNYACKPGQNISGVKPKFAPKFQQMDLPMQY